MPAERGIVRARTYGNRRLEVVDMKAKPLVLEPGQYHMVTR